MAIVALILGCVLSFIIGFLVAKMPVQEDFTPDDDPKLKKQWEEFLNYGGK